MVSDVRVDQMDVGVIHVDREQFAYSRRAVEVERLAPGDNLLPTALRGRETIVSPIGDNLTLVTH